MSQELAEIPTTRRRTVLKAIGAGTTGVAFLSTNTTAQSSSIGEVVFEDEFEDSQLDWTDIDHPEFWSEQGGQVQYSPSTSAGSTGDNYLYADETFDGDEGLLEWPVVLEFRGYASDTSAGLGAFATGGGPKDGRGDIRLGIQDGKYNDQFHVWNSEGEQFALSGARENNTWYTYRLVPDLENNEIQISRNNESWTVPEPNDDPIGNTSIALSGGTCWGCGGNGDRRYDYIKVNGINLEEPQTVITEFENNEVMKNQGNGFQKIYSIHKVSTSNSGRFFGRHKIGVGFRGKAVAGSRAAYHKSFTPETTTEHSIRTEFDISGFSKITQPEVLDVQAHGQNFLSVSSMITTPNGTILDESHDIIYNRAEPEWTDILQDSIVKMAELLIHTHGGAPLQVGGLLLTTKDIAETITTLGTEVDEEYNEPGQLEFSVDLKQDEEYIIHVDIRAISCVDLITQPLVSPLTLAGSFVDFGFSGGIDRVSVSKIT